MSELFRIRKPCCIVKVSDLDFNYVHGNLAYDFLWTPHFNHSFT